MTDREAPPDWGFENWQDDPYEEDGWFGREQVSQPPPVIDRPHTQPVTRTALPPTRRLPSPTVNTWTVNGQLRASNDTALTSRAPPPPWYRTKKATIALVAAASAAAAAPIVILVWPTSPPTISTSTSVAPHTALLDTLRLTAVGETGRRGDANACDPDTDQRGATAAASTENNSSANPGDSPKGFHCGGWC